MRKPIPSLYELNPFMKLQDIDSAMLGMLLDDKLAWCLINGSIFFKGILHNMIDFINLQKYVKKK